MIHFSVKDFCTNLCGEERDSYTSSSPRNHKQQKSGAQDNVLSASSMLPSGFFGGVCGVEGRGEWSMRQPYLISQREI